MTADYIAFHAAERPDAGAVITDGRRITYAELHRDIGKVMRVLGEFGLPPGSSAAVGCDDFYVNWLLLVACEQLGIATASLHGRESPSALPLLGSVDLVLSERHYPEGAARRHHLITAEWVRSALGRADGGEEPALPKAPGDIVRILRTSGTTGASKQLRLSRQKVDARVNGHMWALELNRRSRCLVTVPFTLNSSYVFAIACARAGGTLISERRVPIPQAISANAVTHMVLLPIQLGAVLDALPDGFEKPAELLVLSLGAPLSEALRQRAGERLASKVCDLYGAQESGNIAWTAVGGSAGIATVWPDVVAEVVDEHEERVSAERSGRLRIRTPHMAERYFDDAEASAQMFKNGWFYPGDIAVLHDPRRLELMGRADDLLNIGGTKIPPTELESLILRSIEAKDAGVSSIQNRDGIGEIWIALADCPLEDHAMLQRLEQALGRLQVGRFHVLRLSRIPRNASGKVQRDELRTAIAAAAGLPGARDQSRA